MKVRFRYNPRKSCDYMTVMYEVSNITEAESVGMSNYHFRCNASYRDASCLEA